MRSNIYYYQDSLGSTSHIANVSGGRRFDYAYNSVNDITAVQRDSGNGDGYTYDLTQQILGYQQNGTVNLAAGTVTSPATNTEGKTGSNLNSESFRERAI